MSHKIPQSVLVVIHTPALDVLLIERADAAGFWQSVTGHTLTDWALENVYEIYPGWRHRYAPGVTHNTEHLLGLCIPVPLNVTLAPREHTAQVWLPYREAADRCFSPSNAEAILLLPRFATAGMMQP